MIRATVLFFILGGSISSMAQQNNNNAWNLHFQATYIYQYKPPFHSFYSGKNSLTKEKEEQNSLTATLFAGVRLWKGASFYINPELAGGSGLSGALGMAGSSNGETFRVGNPSPTLYLARAYLTQTFAIGNETEDVEEEADETGGKLPVNFFRLTAGKFSLGDIFDNNTFSNSPRQQFMNWGLMNNGAWDYAANVRGYTYALAASLKLNNVTLNAALASMPKIANGPDLSTAFNKTIALNLEAARSFNMNNREGNIRLLYFMNKAPMGKYSQAIAFTNPADIVKTRLDGRLKHGFGINADQQLNNNAGVFFRAGWNDGKNETWCFTEIDRTVSGGYSMNGTGWKRTNDNFGIALLANGLSPVHRSYLQKGGSGFILGDGRLNYAPEFITELYYKWKPVEAGLWLTADYQLALNPGYNKDRGPVNIFSIRLHAEL